MWGEVWRCGLAVVMVYEGVNVTSVLECKFSVPIECARGVAGVIKMWWGFSDAGGMYRYDVW